MISSTLAFIVPQIGDYSIRGTKDAGCQLEGICDIITNDTLDKGMASPLSLMMFLIFMGHQLGGAFLATYSTLLRMCPLH